MTYVADCAYQAEGFRMGSRTCRRSFVHMPASIRLSADESEAHIAFIRDISPNGMFFYSKLKPQAGEPIEFVLECPSEGTVKRLHLSGLIRRVEEGRSNTAIGVAIEFDHRQDEIPRLYV